MEHISDEQMMGMLKEIKPYVIALVKPGANSNHPELKSIIWEHGRKNLMLRQAGKINIVGPVTAETGVSGLYIFNTLQEEAETILKEDPAVIAGIFTYEIHPWMSFPGDSLK